MPVTFDAAGNATNALFPRGWGLDYHSAVESARLSEDPQIPPHWAASRGSLFRAGHVIAPWSIFVADDGVEVHLTTMRQESPQGNVAAALVPDGGSVLWAGTRSALFIISGRPGDLRPQAEQGIVLDLRYRIDQPPDQEVKVGLRCTEPLCATRTGAMLDVTRAFKNSPPGEWRTLSIPLSCFTEAGADLARVEAPFAVETQGHFGLTISEVSLAPKAARPSAKCPGAMANR
jgi:beta-glucosidase